MRPRLARPIPVGFRRHGFRIIAAVLELLLVASALPARTSRQLSAPPGDQPKPEVVDRVVAVVGRTPILESDVTLARLVDLVPVDPGTPEAERRSQEVAARVRLEVQYRDLEISGTVYRLQFDTDGTVGRLVKRAGGKAKLAPRLAAAGLSSEDVRDLAVRIAAVNAYVEQRLRPQVRVTLPEMRTAYQETLALQITAQGKEPPPFSAVRSQLHRVLAEQKLNDLIERWTHEARSRLDVIMLHP